MAYRIEYSRRAVGNLRRLRVFDRRRIEDTVRQQLSQHPTLETDNRFPMEPNSLAEWELWVDPFRVLYDVEGDVVRVVLVGRKVRERLLEDGTEVHTHA